tara:strand:- start:13997 stop:14338 length:342 start_codon:yes stop_codon:yes gene_type:complete
MKSIYLAGIIAVIAVTASGCASRAGGVAPLAIPASDYTHLSCDEIHHELGLARDRERAFTQRQNNAATADAAGVFLVLLPLGSVFGADNEGNLAQAKGEVRALERAGEINCRD